MRKIIAAFLAVFLAVFLPAAQTGPAVQAQTPAIKLGDDLLMSKYHHLIQGKRVGLVTNQSGVNSRGQSMIDVLANDRTIRLTALYGPEHGIDGQAEAGAYVASYTHPALGIPVYSLYGPNRMPTAEMLDNIDVLLFDIQDIGARSYTYISTLYNCLAAAKQSNKTVIVLDRPNPVGGRIVEGPVLEDAYKSFVGIDNLPMAHGMTIGELAQYFNRQIGALVKVIPLEGYTRNMVYQDTGLTWVPTSPNIPDLASVFGYMATGLGEGTGIYQADKFKWIGGSGIDAAKFAALMNKAGLPGVSFSPEYIGKAGGIRLNILDPHLFNPARTGIYALTYAYSLNHFKVPKSGKSIVMFDKIMGTDKIGQYLEAGLSPWAITTKYAAGLDRFKKEREKYLIYGDQPYQDEIIVLVEERQVSFDSAPYIDENNRLMVPLRSISEALGANVAWDPAEQTVIISGGGRMAHFQVGSTQAQVNGQPKTMDTSPVIKNNRTMVPLRYVGEYLGTIVNWHEDTRTVTVR